VPIACAVWLTGCAEAQMRYNVRNYDAAIADVENKSILLNAVRASQRYPMSFTSAGEVSAIPPVSGSLSSTLNFTRAEGLASFDLNPKIDANAGYQTFQLGNLNSDKFTQLLRGRVPPAILESFKGSGWPGELLELIYVQEIEPPLERPVSLVDRERKARCVTRRTERDDKLCSAIDRNIALFASRCTKHAGHFYNIEQRMHDLHEDRGFYYNTPATFCHFMRFKILLEEIRLLHLDVLCTKPGPRCVRVKYRSALQMIQYLGALIAAQLYIESPFIPSVLYGYSTPDGDYQYRELPLFVVRSGGGERAAVSVYHDGNIYYIPQPVFGSPSEDRSLQTLDLVLQTVRASTQRDFIPKVPTTVAVINR
jgi:hypothetical protein